MMSGKLRLETEQKRVMAVLDTNVFVAAYLSRNPNSPTQEILARWLNDEFDLLYSVDLQAEIAEKFAAKGVAQEATELLLATLAIRGVQVEAPASAVVAIISADPDDDLVLACAVVGGATHLVTYDPHFDVLGRTYQGIHIVDGLGFLGVLRSRPE
jgi:predicted nucleic acid-binding protein